VERFSPRAQRPWDEAGGASWPSHRRDPLRVCAGDPLELEWAIMEDGVCSTIDDQGKDIVAVAAGDEWRLK
jgi:hypothetical protein